MILFLPGAILLRCHRGCHRTKQCGGRIWNHGSQHCRACHRISPYPPKSGYNKSWTPIFCGFFLKTWTLTVFASLSRGRDGGCPPPPAQTRTRGTTASGSHLGSVAEREPLCCSPAHLAARTPIYPGTESRTGLLQSVLLGQRPSLHALRQRSHALARTSRRYYAAARLLDHVHPGLICLRLSPDGPRSSAGMTEVSRFSRMKFPDVPGVSDYAGLTVSSR